MTPFKNRKIDESQPVEVYRNLNKADEVWYSVRQSGLVVAHAQDFVLTDVTFRVSEAGRDRVLKEKRKNVHAFVVGKMHPTTYEWLPPTPFFETIDITYNPYTQPWFGTANLRFKNALAVHFSRTGLKATIRK